MKMPVSDFNALTPLSFWAVVARYQEQAREVQRSSRSGGPTPRASKG